MAEVGPCIWVKDYAISEKICSSIIEKFEDDNRKGAGRTAGGITEIKKSTDLDLQRLDGWEFFDKFLQDKLKKNIYDLANLIKFDQSGFEDIPFYFHHEVGFNLQRTDPDQYYNYHADSWGRDENSNNRTLTYIFYLSDEIDGGYTSFYHQKIKVAPKRGRLLFFPPYWTHLHAGEKVKSGRKYICTGWVHNGDFY